MFEILSASIGALGAVISAVVLVRLRHQGAAVDRIELHVNSRLDQAVDRINLLTRQLARMGVTAEQSPGGN